MVGWHHRLDGHKFEQALQVGHEQGSQALCSPWGCKELDMTQHARISDLNLHESNFLSNWGYCYMPHMVLCEQQRPLQHNLCPQYTFTF